MVVPRSRWGGALPPDSLNFNPDDVDRPKTQEYRKMKMPRMQPSLDDPELMKNHAKQCDERLHVEREAIGDGTVLISCRWIN